MEQTGNYRKVRVLGLLARYEFTAVMLTSLWKMITRIWYLYHFKLYRIDTLTVTNPPDHQTFAVFSEYTPSTDLLQSGICLYKQTGRSVFQFWECDINHSGGGRGGSSTTLLQFWECDINHSGTGRDGSSTHSSSSESVISTIQALADGSSTHSSSSESVISTIQALADGSSTHSSSSESVISTIQALADGSSTHSFRLPNRHGLS